MVIGLCSPNWHFSQANQHNLLLKKLKGSVKIGFSINPAVMECKACINQKSSRCFLLLLFSSRKDERIFVQHILRCFCLRGQLGSENGPGESHLERPLCCHNHKTVPQGHSATGTVSPTVFFGTLKAIWKEANDEWTVLAPVSLLQAWQRTPRAWFPQWAFSWRHLLGQTNNPQQTWRAGRRASVSSMLLVCWGWWHTLEPDAVISPGSTFLLAPAFGGCNWAPLNPIFTKFGSQVKESQMENASSEFLAQRKGVFYHIVGHKLVH